MTVLCVYVNVHAGHVSKGVVTVLCVYVNVHAGHFVFKIALQLYLVPSHSRIRLLCFRLAEKLQQMNYSIEQPKAHKVQIIKDDDKAGE